MATPPAELDTWDEIFAALSGVVGDTSIINVKSFGAIADGASHPLSEGYLTLGSAQAVYPFATNLSQQLDYCACKKASNAAFGGDLEILTSYITVSQASDNKTVVDATQNWTVNEHAGKTAFRKFISNGFVESQTILSNTATILTLAAPFPTGDPVGSTNQYAIGYGEHGAAGATINKPLRIPSGSYRFGSDTWLIRNLVGGKIYGDGRQATIIRGDATCLAFDGLWYSTLRDFSILLQRDDAIAAMEIDGNVPGHAYATRGVQGNSFADLLIDGGNGLYALTMTRQGSSGGQGSENKFDNIHLQNTTFACYYQLGFNALANTFIGGNCQNYLKHALFASGGTFNEDGMGFQSARGYKQIENGGSDIRVGDAGAFEICRIGGSRTESLVFLHNAGAVNVDLGSVVGRAAMPGWSSETTYGALAASYKAIIESGRLFVATTEGTTGVSKPDFPSVADGGTVADGTIVWTETAFECIHNAYGSVNKRTITMLAGSYFWPPRDTLVTVNADFVVLPDQDIVCVDASDGNKVGRFLGGPTSMDRGRAITLKKTDISVNTVELLLPGGFEDGAGSIVIAGGSRGSRTVTYADSTPGGTRRWLLIGSA